MSWSTKKVLECAGIEPKDAEWWVIELAEKCLDRCYYIDRAADELLRILDARRY